jgi:hypothetical protein
VAIAAFEKRTLGRYTIDQVCAIICLNTFRLAISGVTMTDSPQWKHRTVSVIRLAATAASALIVRRRVDRLDLIAVLKTRD